MSGLGVLVAAVAVESVGGVCVPVSGLDLCEEVDRGLLCCDAVGDGGGSPCMLGGGALAAGRVRVCCG
jgi:hypothetical protein